MKTFVRVENSDETSTLTDWVGVTLSTGDRGAILNVGGSYRIICAKTYQHGRRNLVCKGSEDNYTPEDTLRAWEHIYRNGLSPVSITSTLCFDSYKELMTWFTEGIGTDADTGGDDE